MPGFLGVDLHLVFREHGEVQQVGVSDLGPRNRVSMLKMRLALTVISTLVLAASIFLHDRRRVRSGVLRECRRGERDDGRDNGHRKAKARSESVDEPS